MKIETVEHYEELSRKAATIVAGQVSIKNNAVLGLATGSTTEGMYSRLAAMHREDSLDFKETVTFNLDEYLGLPPGHPQSYHYYMHKNLFDHINIPRENIHIPDGETEEPEAYCSWYDKKVEEAGGIDLQVLGIGTNGHIGFNEPAENLQAQTHVVDLAAETIEANSRFFRSPREVPRRAITMGMGSIMKSRKILLLAGGPKKARAIRDTVKGGVTTRVPASFLQLHPHVTLVLDREAAALL